MTTETMTDVGLLLGRVLTREELLAVERALDRAAREWPAEGSPDLADRDCVRELANQIVAEAQ